MFLGGETRVNIRSMYDFFYYGGRRRLRGAVSLSCSLDESTVPAASIRGCANPVACNDVTSSMHEFTAPPASRLLQAAAPGLTPNAPRKDKRSKKCSDRDEDKARPRRRGRKRQQTS